MKKILIILVLLLVAATVFFIWQKRHTARAAQTKYQIVKVETGDIEVKVLSTGTIQPYTRVAVRASQRGRIDKSEVNEGDIVKKDDILAWLSNEDRIVLLDAARSALESARKENNETAIKEAERAYEIADKAYKPVPITTSISGEVIKRSCEPGQNVSLEDVLFVLSDRLVANVEVDEADIGMVKVRQKASIVLDAFPEERVDAKVTKISLEGRIVSDVVVYDVLVDAVKVPKYWSSGMTANVEFIAASKKDILIVPASAIRDDNGKKFVIVLEGKPAMRPVKTGITDRKMVEISEGLNQGDTVIVGEIKDSQWRPNAINRSMRLLGRPR